MMAIFDASIFLTLLYILLPIWEFLLYLSINTNFYLDDFRKNPSKTAEEINETEVEFEKRKDESKTLASQNLTLIAATVASLAFLLPQLQARPELAGPVSLVGQGLFLIFASFIFAKVAPVRRWFFTFQDLFQSYGLIAITTGLAFAYSTYFNYLSNWIIGIPIVILAVRAYEAVTQFFYLGELRKLKKTIKSK